MIEQVNTIVIGAGQGGLSTSYYLKQQGIPHIIFEQANHVADAWHQRWDSFTLITPNWMIRLPGAEYKDATPDGFMPKDELIAYFEEYVEKYKMPVKYNCRVSSVETTESGFFVRTNQGDFEAANVVIATGMYQQARFPPFSSNLSKEIMQLHSSEYSNPGLLPAGAVLVVGSAQSGCQIAEELYQAGRKVYLSVSRAGRFPRRYLGKDITRWLEETGFADRTVDKLPSPKMKYAGSAQGTGRDGGHTINLHQFVRDGVILLGHIQDAQEGQITLAPDLKENLANTDNFESEFLKEIDNFIEKSGSDAPSEKIPVLKDGYGVEIITELDLKSANIASVIWATGYKFDFSMVKLPIFDEDGYPIQKRGVTEYPGLYFIGLPFLHTVKSGLLAGVGDDAAYVVSAIASSEKSPVMDI